MRRVLVTGGGSGIGRAIARAFAQSGDTVTITGRRRDALEETAQGTAMLTQVADICDEAAVSALFETPFDVVVANAGKAYVGKVRDTELSDFQSVLDINLTGVFLTFRAALRAGMPENGRLIAIASTSSLQGGANLSAYVASKHGVLGLVRSLAIEVARDGVTCNAVCPGFVDTDMADLAVRNVMERFDVDREKATGIVTSNNPMRRMIAPGEVVAAVKFLASPEASSVNGHALSVSGGEI